MTSLDQVHWGPPWPSKFIAPRLNCAAATVPLLCGEAEQATSLAQVHWATLTFGVYYTEVELCSSDSLLGGEAEQTMSLDWIR